MKIQITELIAEEKIKLISCLLIYKKGDTDKLKERLGKLKLV